MANYNVKMNKNFQLNYLFCKLKSKKVSRIISALLVVILVASLGVTTVSANNHDDKDFTFSFNASSPLSWTAVREKTDSTSMYAYISNLDGAYYVICYGAKANDLKTYGGSGSDLPSHLTSAASYHNVRGVWSPDSV